MGEGEAPLLHWLSGAEASHPGLLRNGFNDQPCHWYAPDVDALPDWDRELFHFVSNDGNRYEQAVPIAFSRGFCPFSCTCGVDGYQDLQTTATQGITSAECRSRRGRAHRSLTQHRNPMGFAVWDEVIPRIARGLSTSAPDTKQKSVFRWPFKCVWSRPQKDRIAPRQRRPYLRGDWR